MTKKKTIEFSYLHQCYLCFQIFMTKKKTIEFSYLHQCYLSFQINPKNKKIEDYKIFPIYTNDIYVSIPYRCLNSE